MFSKGNLSGEIPLGPNAQFIGQDDARSNLNTPALILDIDCLDRNISLMAKLTKNANIALRPHAKCHKTVQIAKRQIMEGAVGVCCANIGEAEIMVEGGIHDILITSPLASLPKIKRLCDLAQHTDKAKIVVDNLENVRALSQGAYDHGVTLQILVDIDAGMHRTGVSDSENILIMAQLINSLPNIEFFGLQCYAGHLQHIGTFEERRVESEAIAAKVAAIRDLLIAEGITPQVISGGGTGTHDIDAALQVFTELQAGSYIFMDSQYNNVWENDGIAAPFETALFVQSTVISTNNFGAVTTDAGLKHYAVDGGAPIPIKGVPSGALYQYAGDEFGIIQLASEDDDLPLSSHIECIVPHCDPTVNLYNVIHCFSGDTLVDIWPIAARGA